MRVDVSHINGFEQMVTTSGLENGVINGQIQSLSITCAFGVSSYFHIAGLHVFVTGFVS